MTAPAPPPSDTSRTAPPQPLNPARRQLPASHAGNLAIGTTRIVLLMTVVTLMTLLLVDDYTSIQGHDGESMENRRSSRSTCSSQGWDPSTDRRRSRRAPSPYAAKGRGWSLPPHYIASPPPQSQKCLWERRHEWKVNRNHPKVLIVLPEPGPQRKVTRLILYSRFCAESPCSKGPPGIQWNRQAPVLQSCSPGERR